LAQLAIGLSGRGYAVEVLIYHPADHYRPSLEAEHIPVRLLRWHNRVQRIWVIRRALEEMRPDVVIAFKTKPSLYAELSRLCGGKYRLIVSERNHDHRGFTMGGRLRMSLHSFADAVVANSQSQFELIRTRIPRLRSRLAWIPNAVDLERFHPRQNRPSSAECRLLILARFEEQKNPIRFVQAMVLLRTRCPDRELAVDWYGANYMADGMPTPLSKTYLAVKAEVAKCQLEPVFHLHEPVRDVVSLLHGCDALCLPSLYEGCSNVIGEALACGVPVLASRVSDNPLMVHDGENGFLFDPRDPEDIANAVIRFCSCPPQQRQAMGCRSRRIAEDLLSPARFIEQYERLLVG
jgi:glycosyltransferase involved in cell wall biosynthesis